MQTEMTANGPEVHGTDPEPASEPPALEEIARHFPSLEILELLGRGGMGVVYKARQPRLDRLVALKLLAPEKEKDPQFAERFAREAKALARLSHPNVVTVHDFGEADGLYYLIMEFVDGVSLRQLLQSRRLAPEEALTIVPKICEALQYAHDQGVVHRDIKPENVLVDKQGRLKIADFGIARIVGRAGQSPSPSAVEKAIAKPSEGTLTQDQVLGTPHYMAPEQVEKPQLVDHRADIYSLGVVFYEMLTGELPLGKFAPPSTKVRVDVRLDEVVLHALEKEPERRYQQASQVKTDVETIAATRAPGSSGHESAQDERTAVGRQAVDPPHFSRTAIWGAGCLAAAVSAVLGVVLAAGEINSLAVQAPLLERSQIFSRWHPIAWVLVLAQVLGVLSALAGTTLGGIAISQIRHSRGRVYGLGLAVFDALLVPLLALNGLLIGWWNFVADELADAWIPHLGRGLFTILILGLITVTCGIASWLVIRAVWRAANKPVRHGVTSGQAAGIRPVWPWVAAGILVVIVLPVLLLISLRGPVTMPYFISALRDGLRDQPRTLQEPFPSAQARPGEYSVERPRTLQEPFPSAQARPGEYSVELTNGVSFEVLAICRNPRGSSLWWKPDGTPFSTPPVQVLTLPELKPTRESTITVNPTNEFLIYIQEQWPTDWPWYVSRTVGNDWTPQPSDVELPSYIRDLRSGRKANAQLICFGEPPDSVDYRVKTASGPWEPIAVYDGKKTRELVRGVMIVCSSPTVPAKRSDFQFEVMHNVNREIYAMRLIARFKNDETKELDFHPGPVRGNPSKGFAIIHPGDFDPADVKDYVIERTPWTCGEIRNISLVAREPSAVQQARTDILRIKLRQAEEAAALAETSFKAGRIPQSELQAARDEVAVLKAEIDGDPIQVAQLRLTAAQNRLTRAKVLFDSGLVPSSDYQAARNAVELRQAELRAVQAAQGKVAPSNSSNKAAFGPVKEVSLTEFNSMDGREALDLDSGTLLAQPKEANAGTMDELLVWLEQNGVDLIPDQGPGGVWGIITPAKAALKLALVAVEKWNESSEEELGRTLAAGGATSLEIIQRNGLMVYVPPATESPPLTFVFRTAAGRSGVLQITEFTTHPAGVKLRYKLFKSASQGTAD